MIEYIIRQRTTHINCAPEDYTPGQKFAWLVGHEEFGTTIITLLNDPEELRKKIPEKKEKMNISPKGFYIGTFHNDNHRYVEDMVKITGKPEVFELDENNSDLVWRVNEEDGYEFR